MTTIPFFLLLVLALPLTSASASSLRCGGRLVSTGDAKIDLLAKCGPPATAEARQDERTVRAFDVSRKRLVERRTTVNVEIWAYNFGPSEFLYFVRLEDGRVSNIDRGGYGYADPGAGSRAGVGVTYGCDGREFALGQTKGEVVARCGNPALRESREVSRSAARFDRSRREFLEVETRTFVDEWTYNFGPGRFLYFVRFEDGKLVSIETGGYGYPAD
ncbi:MAG: DUF2845 domain-containing protein [Deltaproteobacteria bacterium]|nr:DUF2845 domain-containing protein [Deltaproteobacteria bacterium]